jgi:hypothetical protein
MNQKEAFEYGMSVGMGIGECNRADYSDFDPFFDECLEIESDHFRQFSPFEFYAKEFNQESRIEVYFRTDNQGRTQHHERSVKQDPDKMWEKYESGVAEGLRAAWREK